MRTGWVSHAARDASYEPLRASNVRSIEKRFVDSLMRVSHGPIALAMVVMLCGCAALYTPRQPLPIAEVAQQSKSGAPPAQIIQHIKQSGTTYALRGSDFAKLRAVGVPDPVLDYLQQSLVDDIDLLTRYWVLGENLGGCSFCYPQPVDLATMQSGYGVVSAPSPTRYSASKPPGTPEWVPSSLPASRQRLNVDQLVELARSGMSDAQLIDRIRNSRLDNVIGVGGFTTIRTRPLGGLTGSRLAQLKEEGVSDAALDALQAQFLAQFIEAERLRYQNLGHGPGSMN